MHVNTFLFNWSELSKIHLKHFGQSSATYQLKHLLSRIDGNLTRTNLVETQETGVCVCTVSTRPCWARAVAGRCGSGRTWQCPSLQLHTVEDLFWRAVPTPPSPTPALWEVLVGQPVKSQPGPPPPHSTEVLPGRKHKFGLSVPQHWATLIQKEPLKIQP